MKKKVIIIISTVLIIIFAYYLYSFENEYTSVKDLQKERINMIITSTFANGSEIPKKYTCDSEGINPPLTFKDIPPAAKSLILFLEDPDAPSGTFNHWMVWNISPTVTNIKENSSPSGAITGVNSTGKKIYTPPCPPNGEHRYFFKVFALDTLLNISADAGKGDLEKAMEGHVLDEGILMGKYSRK